MSFIRLDNIFQKTIKISFYLLFIVTPLILTPWNYELFEFNKMLAVYALTAVIAGAWAGRMILQKKIIFKKSPFDIPLILFLASQFLSTLFSIDRHTSFFGYYSRFHGGLLSTICYLFLYWAFVTNFSHLRGVPRQRRAGAVQPHLGGDFVRNCLKVILATALIVSSYGILEHYGVDASLWVQDVQNRVFSTLGQPNWLAAYLSVLIPITLGFALSSKLKVQSFDKLRIDLFKPERSRPQSRRPERSRTGQSSKSNFTVYWLLFTVYCLCFFYTKSQSGLFGLGLGLMIFWLLLFWQNFSLPAPNEALSEQSESKGVVGLFLFFIFSFLFLFSRVGFNAYPQIASLVQKLGYGKSQNIITETVTPGKVSGPALETGGSSSGEIRKIVWQGAVDIWKHYPFFGSGVETFAYSYYNYRPVEHNLVSEWDFLYNKAHNEYLNFLATTGLVGLGTYLLFIISFIVWFIRIDANINSANEYCKYSHNEIGVKLILLGLFSGWLSILITNFFGFSVVPVALFFFLIPAFCVVLAEPATSHPARHASQGEAGRQPPDIRHQSSITSHQSSVINNFQKFGFLILLIAESWLLITVINLWRADVHYAKGDKFNKINRYDLAFTELLSAINLNNGEPVYRNEIAEASSNLAIYAFQQKDTANATKFAQVAISQSDQALKTSPANLNFWKGRVKVLFNLSQLNKDFQPTVIETIKTAMKLAPTDPKLPYNLGLIYTSFNQKDSAIGPFQEAIKLKPDYKDARFTLATLLKEKGQKEEAKEQLEYILKNLSPSDTQSAKLLQEMNY